MTPSQLDAAARRYCELREWPIQEGDLKRAAYYLCGYQASEYKADPDADAAIQGAREGEK